MTSQRPDSEGLIPVEHHHPSSSVSPLPSQQSHQPQDSMAPMSSESNITPLSPSSEQSGTLPPTYEKPRQGGHDAPIPVNEPPAAPEKAYEGQGSYANQAPGPYPGDVKAYPGQPGQTQQPPQQMYYTPHGHPSGYATAIPLHALQSAPCPVDCPACGRREMTRVQPVSGMTTHGWAAILCFCCCLGCIPYLMSSLKDVDHYCGNCNSKLACWHNSGRVDVCQFVPASGAVPQAAPTGPRPPPPAQKYQ